LLLLSCRVIRAYQKERTMDAQPPHTSIHLMPHPTRGQQRSRERRKVAREKTRSDDTMMCPRPTKRLRRQKPRNSGAKSQIIKILPNDIISNILFEYLYQSPKQLSTIRSVCTLFRAMARDSFTELHLRPDITRKANLILTHSLTNNMINQFINLKEIDFSFCDNFDDRQLELLSPMMRSKKLRVLKLRGTQISDEGVIKLFAYDKCLQWCEAQWAVVADTHSEQIPTNKKHEIEPRPSVPLEVLDLSENGITNKSLLAVAYTCLELKHLSLSMCTAITDDFLESVPLFLVNLTFLDISMCSITSRGCCHLARMPALRTVDISACPELSGQALAALVTGKHPPPSICDDAVNEILDDDQDMMQKLGLTRENGSVSQLTTIAARFAEGIDANLLDTLATCAPHLHTLDLRHYRGNDLKTGFLSPMKMSLRKLRQNGMEVAFSRVDTRGMT